MSFPSDNFTIDFKTSCTKEEAVAKLLGWLRGPICHESAVIEEHGVPADQLQYLDSLVFSLQEHLIGMRQEAMYKASEVVDAGGPEEIIQQRLEDVLKVEDLIKKAHKYFLDIDEELDKADLSALKIDKAKTEEMHEIHITLKSLDIWARINYGIQIIDQLVPVTANIPQPQSHPSADIKPWLIPIESDPPAEQSWYTPARYFARDLIKQDSTLLTKRDILALKVGQSLVGVGIYKRGGKKPHSPGTIKKALVNINFS